MLLGCVDYWSGFLPPAILAFQLPPMPESGQLGLPLDYDKTIGEHWTAVSDGLGVVSTVVLVGLVDCFKTPGTHFDPLLKLLAETVSPSTMARSVACQSCACF